MNSGKLKGLANGFFIAMAMILPLSVSAYKVTIDGVEYNCNKTSKRASVQGPVDPTITKVSIPDRILDGNYTFTVTSIAKEAFDGCTELKTVEMGDGIETIGSCAFSDTGITKIRLSQGLKVIGNAAFYNANMTSLTIPDGVEIIRANAFKCCRELKTLKLGRSVKEIGDNAFEKCYALTAVDMPNSVKTIGKACFVDCNALKKVVLSTALTVIPEDAFQYAPVENISIHNGITSIGSGAFMYNNTPIINIPASVKVIEPWAFACGTGHTVNPPRESLR